MKLIFHIFLLLLLIPYSINNSFAQSKSELNNGQSFSNTYCGSRGGLEHGGRKVFLKKINISINVKKCISNEEENQLIFIIQNNNSTGFWIHSWHLIPDSIKTKNGDYIQPNILVEYQAPNIPEYSWVSPESELKISYNTDFFRKFSLSKIEKYSLFSSYSKYATPKKNAKEYTLEGPIYIRPILFWTCP